MRIEGNCECCGNYTNMSYNTVIGNICGECKGKIVKCLKIMVLEEKSKDHD